MLGKPFYQRLRDDEYYDEIRITTVPRYKTSGLSGDEWRVSARVTILRKGHVILETSFNKIRSAVALLPGVLLTLFEGDEIKRIPDSVDHALCFQPGCEQPAVTTYKLKHEYCDRGEQHPHSFSEMRVAFCQKHLTRGDCGLQDADENYELVSGLGPEATDWRDATISESQRVMVAVDSIEEIPTAVQNVIKDAS